VAVADDNDLVAVARIAKTRGIRGEVAADLLTDFPERFAGLQLLTAVTPTGERRCLTIEEQWFHGDRIVFKFAGYDSIEEAKPLVGTVLSVPASERVQAPADHYFESELAECRVETVDGEEIGKVREVMRTGGVELLVIDGKAGREMLIPMAADICVEINVTDKVIKVDPPEGLLEL
jgi:16S rRNA processing protein RimM